MGMIAEAQLAGQSSHAIGTPVAPLSAVVRWPKSDDSYAVYVVNNEHGKLVARARRITLGETLGNTIEVRTGLSNGDRVITNGATLVRDSSVVTIVQ
jgi:multidrug efflux pump subunit AcrA (membrane-fusion protein)